MQIPRRVAPDENDHIVSHFLRHEVPRHLTKISMVFWKAALMTGKLLKPLHASSADAEWIVEHVTPTILTENRIIILYYITRPIIQKTTVPGKTLGSSQAKMRKKISLPGAPWNWLRRSFTSAT